MTGAKHESRGVFVLACVVLIFTVALASFCTGPPRALPASASAGEFSGERARAALGVVLGSGAAHPVGSSENEAVRNRIAAHLTELGYAPELETGLSCSRWGTCARVTNVVARHAGKADLPAVVLAAHYDSVPAGAGASDDGLGVATLLEIARAISQDPPGERPILLLFDDGEEAGLLGAEAFVKKHAALRESGPKIGIVINVEARGTRGPSLMFETSGESAPLVELFAKSAKRPLTSSLFYSVYRRLPNDTDLTVFKREGVPGLNFAVIGGVQHYHTPLDDFAHASSESLQHGGQNVLAIARRLANSASLPTMHGGDAVFFDFLGLGIVRWPIGWTRVIAIAVVLIWCLALATAFRKRVLAASGFLRAASVWPLAAVLSTIVVFGIFAAIRALGRLPAFPWLAHPLPALVISPATAVTLSASSALIRRRSSAWDEWAACFSWWTVFLLALAFALPEATYLLLVPIAGAGVAAIAGLSFTSESRALAIALVVPIALTGALWFPVLGLTYDALGFAVPALYGAATALALAPFFPALSAIEPTGRKRVLALSAIVLGVATIAAIFVPVYSPESPSRTSVAFHWDGDAKRARYLIEAANDVPKSLLGAAGFTTHSVDPTPWIGTWRSAAFEAPAPTIERAPPVWDVIEQTAAGTGVRVRARLRSQRGSQVLGLFVPIEAGLRSLRIEDQPARTRTINRNESATFLGAGSDGIFVELELAKPASIVIWDQSVGLPAGAERILDARPKWAVPSQFGDITLASRIIPASPL